MAVSGKRIKLWKATAAAVTHGASSITFLSSAASKMLVLSCYTGQLLNYRRTKSYRAIRTCQRFVVHYFTWTEPAHLPEKQQDLRGQQYAERQGVEAQAAEVHDGDGDLEAVGQQVERVPDAEPRREAVLDQCADLRGARSFLGLELRLRLDAG